MTPIRWFVDTWRAGVGGGRVSVLFGWFLIPLQALRMPFGRDGWREKLSRPMLPIS